MFIVKSSNLLNGREYSAKFETEAEANAWAQKQIAKKSWGKPARQAVRGQDEFDESLVLSEFEDEDEILGTRTIVSLRAEYDHSIEEIDVTANNDDAKAERARIAAKKAAQFKVFKDFGETVELYFTALINERGYTQAQKDSIQADSDVLAILNELKFGRIAKAKTMVDNKNADESLFYQEDLNAVSLLMADFLGNYPL